MATSISVKASLNLLKRQMLPDDDRLAQAIFVCLGFGKILSDKSKIKEVGIARLDMRDLQHHQSGVPTPLRTQNYRNGKLYKYYRFPGGKPGEYFDSDGFNWGKTKWISKCQIRDLIEKTIKQADRNVIPVAHYAYCEVSVTQRMGIDLLDKQKFPSLLGIIDTETLACFLIPRPDGVRDVFNRFSLEHLLIHLEIPHWKLHLSGNDANATLKALFIPACLSFQKLSLSIPQKKGLSTFISIAKEFVPVIFGPTSKFVERFHTKAGVKRFIPKDWVDNLKNDGLGLVILDSFEWTPPLKIEREPEDWADAMGDGDDCLSLEDMVRINCQGDTFK